METHEPTRRRIARKFVKATMVIGLLAGTLIIAIAGTASPASAHHNCDGLLAGQPELNQRIGELEEEVESYEERRAFLHQRAVGIAEELAPLFTRWYDDKEAGTTARFIELNLELEEINSERARIKTDNIDPRNDEIAQLKRELEAIADLYIHCTRVHHGGGSCGGGKVLPY